MTNFNFLKYKNFFLILSTFLVITSIILIFVKGLDFGVDFKGGTTIEIRLEKKIEIEKLRNSLSKLKINNYSVKEFGSANDFLISTDNSVSPGDIKSSIEKDLNEKISIRKVESVGPKIGSELIRSAIYSVLLSLILQL
jgi:preprotein translocase subunit SecF